MRETYGIDLAARYLGVDLPHPIGKASGQLSLNATQLEDDAAAGLACAILKTVIAEDETGARAMAAWAIHETRMKVERRGRSGWTVTWKGRGWDRSLAEYLALVRTGRDLARATGMLVVPSVKYHLPRLAEPFRDGEYRHTTRRLAGAWGEPPLLLEKDFSPTLADCPPGRHRQRLLGPRAARIRAARLRKRAAPHLLPAAALPVPRDPRVAHPARAARAGIRSAGRLGRGDVGARGPREARAPRRGAPLPGSGE